MKLHIIALAAVAALVASCNEAEIDIFDSPATEATTGTVTATDATASSLRFEWAPVAGANQYGYLLADASGAKVRQGVTNNTSITFENLELNTAYALTLEAYGANGAPTLIFHAQGSTLNIQQLAAPDASKFALDIAGGVVTITWQAVPHAETYDYVVLTAAGATVAEGTVADTQLQLAKLALGDYTLQLTADTTDKGYTRSATTSWAFTRYREVLNTYSGTYQSHSMGTYDCQIVVFDTGGYAIKAFYGVEGYDLEFSLGTGNAVQIDNAYASSGNVKTLHTGLADKPDATIIQDAAHCSYSAMPSGKKLKVHVTLTGEQEGGTDTFTWKEK